MISEERQRHIYEWAHPELRGEHWRESHGSYGDGLYAEDDRDGIRHRFPITALYLAGVPNYQWFFTEAVPRLLKERCSVGASFLGRQSDAWWIERWGDRTLGMNIDPIAALADYVEAQGGGK